MRWTLLLLLAGCAAHEVERRRPSFVILITDDQRADAVDFPELRRLAAEGVVFKNAFVTTSICSISRASLMSGRLCRTHRVGDFATALDVETFPARLKKAGYRTGCFGKWGIGGKLPLQDFDVWDAWSGQGQFFHGEVHNSEWLANKAIEFIRSTPPGRPYCLVVLFKAPHHPYQPDPRDKELFRDVDFPAPPSDFDKLPDFLRTSEARARYDQWVAPIGHAEFVRNYLRCVAGVDRALGRIRAALDADTILAYTSDNGFLLGEHGLIEKWQMWEESIRVPLRLAGPGIPAKAIDGLALNIDLAPTILDYAGLSAEGMDGRSLRPLIEGRGVPWRRDFFYEHHFTYKGRIPRTEGVRTERWKYVTYVDPPYEQLFDLHSDPRELRNLAGDPSAAAQLEALRARHRDYVASLPPAVVRP